MPAHNETDRCISMGEGQLQLIKKALGHYLLQAPKEEFEEVHTLRELATDTLDQPHDWQLVHDWQR